MKTLKSHRALALLSMVALAACDDAAPTAPIMNDVLTFDETVELEVLASTENAAVALALADASNNVASVRGDMRTKDGRDLHEEARRRFSDARDALARGDHRTAVDEARDARRFVVRAIVATGGGRAVVAMVERLEAMALTVPEDDESFADPAAVASELTTLALEARDALSRGDTTRAGERAVFGDQRRHDRRRDHRGDRRPTDRGSDVGPRRAQIALELGATAVELAERLIETDVASDEQSRFLALAHELLQKARAAFAGGHYGRTAHFAELASWAALKAVVLPGGITTEEMRAMLDLASSLLEQARLAIGDAPTELQLSMFRRAARLIEAGERMVAAGKQRGVGPLWQGAVISRWLIG